MQHIVFNDLVIKKQARYDIKALKKKPETIAYDTETIEGKARLICNSDGESINPQSFEDCIKFLCRHKTRSKIAFWYNIRYDFQAILKWLPDEDWKTIYTLGKIIKGIYQIMYIPRKMLLIRNLKLKRVWRHYDISQYYHMTLNNAAKKYLGASKLDHGKDIANLTETDITDKVIVRYCIQDAVLTKRLADKWIDICWGQGLQTKNFCSTASTSSRYFMSEVSIPSINSFLVTKLGKRMLNDAWNTVSGALISTYRRGYFPAIYEYDINSAYPYAMSNYPDVRKGYFARTTKAKELTNAYLGWLKVRVEINEGDEGYFHPAIPMLRKNQPNYYPIGVYETYLTLNEYKIYKQFWSIKFLEGTIWIPTEDITYLFKDIIEKLYYKRKHTKDDNVNFFIKIILNSIYGKFLQKHKITDPESKDIGKYKTGLLFNPFIASYILADTRLSLFKLMLGVDTKHIIATFTDSLVTDIPLDIQESACLGEFSPASTGEMVIVGSGVYTIRGDKLKSRLRGFNVSEKEEDNLFELLKKYHKSDEIPVNVNMNYSPIQCIIQKKPELMNIIKDGQRNIKINFDTKRLWSYYPNKAGYLLDNQIDSEPLTLIR